MDLDIDVDALRARAAATVRRGGSQSPGPQSPLSAQGQQRLEGAQQLHKDVSPVPTGFEGQSEWGTDKVFRLGGPGSARGCEVSAVSYYHHDETADPVKGGGSLVNQALRCMTAELLKEDDLEARPGAEEDCEPNSLEDAAKAPMQHSSFVSVPCKGSGNPEILSKKVDSTKGDCGINYGRQDFPAVLQQPGRKIKVRLRQCLENE